MVDILAKNKKLFLKQKLVLSKLGLCRLLLGPQIWRLNSKVLVKGENREPRHNKQHGTSSGTSATQAFLQASLP